MATFRRFEEIVAWVRAKELTREIYAVSGRGAWSRDFALRDQIRRAAISAMSNIAEGFERDGRKEFVQLLSVAKGSVGELRSQLYVARDQGFIAEAEFDRLHRLAEGLGRTIGGLMKYLRTSKARGKKFGQTTQLVTRNS